MKSHTEYLTFHTRKHREYVHITPQVEAAVKKSGVQDGLALVSAMHITAGIYVNDDESGLIEDIDQWLETLAPFRQDYRHHQTGEDNGDSHLKAILVHHQVILPITAGRLDLGTWQRVFYAEFDGRRSKRVILKIIGD
ncbi:MAG TPA: secondary thiamine-phosphate synthase enzyme YjbQ [Terriglobales bacterium]|jgi:secondary thiamine-phosphate synthase enzyme|nr:secondary thiamine-phosphate synthase enzyme YjbQ [Terriglobales bacterium]